MLGGMVWGPACNRRGGDHTMGRVDATVTIDTEACKGCVLCIDVCPPRVLEMTVSRVNRTGYRYPVLLDGCTGCELCARICPDFCFEVFRGDEPAGAVGADVNRDAGGSR